MTDEDAPDEDAPIEEFDGFISHPKELLACYFLPLPEPLSVSGEITTPQYESVLPRDLKHLEGMGLEFDISPIEPFPEAFDGDWVVLGNHLFRSSIMFHQANSRSRVMGEMDAAIAVAAVASGTLKRPVKGQPVIASPRRISRRETQEAAENGVGAVTVAEVVIPLRLIGDIPEMETSINETIKDIPHLASFARGLPENVPTPSYDLLSTSPYPLDETVKGRIIAGLHLAVLELRRVQRAYHTATGHPITLISTDGIAPSLPVLLRHRADISTPRRGRELLIRANDNYWSMFKSADMEPHQVEMFATQLSSPEPLLMHNFLDFRREAQVSLYRTGDTRAAAIYCGLAAETFLDQVLLHLMWEQALRPEDAANSWRQVITDRVWTDFPARLGGSWDGTKAGVVKNWLTKVAYLRNSVVHTGYIPTYDECSEALAAVADLVEYVGDRLCTPNIISKYPRTALSVASRSGVQRRGSYSRRVRDIEADPKEVSWRATFNRWQNTFRLCRRDSSRDPRRPSLTGAKFFAIIHTDDRVEYIAHDLESAMVIELQAGSIGSEFQKETLETIVAALPSREEMVFVEIEPGPSDVVVSQGTWMEAYRRIPNEGVMVDRNDR
jgi:hypothetical protein